MIHSPIISPLRRKVLPVKDLDGEFQISSDTVREIYDVLRWQSSDGQSMDGNEGLVFLAGRQDQSFTCYSTIVVPQVRNTYGSVYVDAKDFGKCAKRARRDNLQILAQLHSHPGDCCHHSDGDDKLIILPFEGMLSIVVPHYGHYDLPLQQCGIHQHHKGSWYLCTDESVARQFYITPSKIIVK